MAKRLTNSVVNGAAKRHSDYFIWDGDLKGFGLKVCSGGRKSYVCKYRLGTGRNAPTRRMTIGADGARWRPDQARKRASQILGLVAHGEDRRSGIDRVSVNSDPPGLTADTLLFLDNGHVIPARGEPGGAGQPAHSCPDDDDFLPHLPAFRPASGGESRQYH